MRGTNDDVEVACEELAQHFESFDSSSIRRDLNEDRQVAGYPSILDDAAVEFKLWSPTPALRCADACCFQIIAQLTN